MQCPCTVKSSDIEDRGDERRQGTDDHDARLSELLLPRPGLGLVVYRGDGKVREREKAD